MPFRPKPVLEGMPLWLDGVLVSCHAKHPNAIASEEDMCTDTVEDVTGQLLSGGNVDLNNPAYSKRYTSRKVLLHNLFRPHQREFRSYQGFGKSMLITADTQIAFLDFEEKDD